MGEIKLLVTTTDEFGPEDASRLREALSGLSEIDEALVDTDDDPERDLAGTLATVGVVLTTAAGTAAALQLLLDKVRSVVQSARGLKEVVVHTPSGPVPLQQATVQDIATTDQQPT